MKPKAAKPGEFTDYNAQEQAAIKRLMSPEHPDRAGIDWIIYKVCGLSDIGYYQTPTDTAFAAGRRSVAVQIALINELPFKTETTKEELHARSRRGPRRQT